MLLQRALAAAAAAVRELVEAEAADVLQGDTDVSMSSITNSLATVSMSSCSGPSGSGPSGSGPSAGSGMSGPHS